MDLQEYFAKKYEIMPYRKYISKALGTLLSFQNEDGGIPATLPEKQSGCWTSASTLESILVSGTYPSYGLCRIKNIIKYLLNTQFGATELPKAKSFANGSWALFKGADPSTMTTGHSVGALLLAKKFIDDDPHLTTRMANAISNGFKWIQVNQNNDGGWGTLPNSGISGAESAIIATHYALLPYYYNEENMHTSATVRKGVEYLLKLQNQDGSWGIKKGKSGDVCNTARAISAIVRAGYRNRDCIEKGFKYIMNNQIKGGNFWEIEAERFDIENAPAQVIYNDNTNCDVLMAFLEANKDEQLSRELFVWLLKTQQDDGLWYLCSPTKTVNEISTWSTAEWTLVVDKASRVFFNEKNITKIQEKSSIRNRVFIGLLLLGVLINTFYTYKDLVYNSWVGLSAETRTLIWTGVILAVAVNLLAALFYDILKAWFLALKSHLNKFFKN